MPDKPPFSKINLLSRKAKDERGMASIAQGGDYKIRSKNKINNPNNPSQTLSRGSNVHVGMKSETITKPGPMSPTTHEERPIDIPVKKFVPGSFHGNKPVDERTSMESGKVRHEHPAKTQMRIEAQKNQQTSYNFKGKEEYSGRHETTYKQGKIKIPVPGKPTVVKETITRPVTTVTKPVKAASTYVPKKQSFENTPWTSTKKQTKAFTSHPNSGGRTKIKWNGGKVKVN